MIKYVITLSKNFPATHIRKGEETKFAEQVLAQQKIHTVRANYDLWKKRFEKVEKGLACIVLRQWSEKPYRSKQVDIITLTKENGIGLQKLEFTQLGIFIDDIDSDLTYKELANNDGLSLQDYHAWFKNYPTSPQAVIHFTGKRYANSKTHKGKGSWLMNECREQKKSEAKEM